MLLLLAILGVLAGGVGTVVVRQDVEPAPSASGPRPTTTTATPPLTVQRGATATTVTPSPTVPRAATTTTSLTGPATTITRVPTPSPPFPTTTTTAAPPVARGVPVDPDTGMPNTGGTFLLAGLLLTASGALGLFVARRPGRRRGEPDGR